VSSIMNYWSPIYAPASPRASNGDPLPSACARLIIYTFQRSYTIWYGWFMVYMLHSIYIILASRWYWYMAWSIYAWAAIPCWHDSCNYILIIIYLYIHLFLVRFWLVQFLVFLYLAVIFYTSLLFNNINMLRQNGHNPGSISCTTTRLPDL